MDTAQRGRRSSPRGFSLIEVLITIVIIGILAAVAVPMYLGQRDKAHNADARQGGRIIVTGLLTYVIALDDGEPWPAECTKELIVGSGSLEESEWPRNPWTGEDMQQVGGISLGDYRYVAEPRVGGKKQRYHLQVFLKGAPAFIVP